VQCHVPGEHGITWSMFPGTWCKPRDTMHLCWFFGPTAVLGRSICILCWCVIDDNTNMLHSWYNKTYWLALGQHCTTSGHYISMLPSAPVNILVLHSKWHVTCTKFAGWMNIATVCIKIVLKKMTKHWLHKLSALTIKSAKYFALEPKSLTCYLKVKPLLT